MDRKKYIVIGGSSGIGLSVVNRITAEGHEIIHYARNKGEWEHPDQITHYSFDITKGNEPEINNDSADGLVYCPGTINLKPFIKLSDEDFRNDFEINALGAVRMIRSFYKVLRKGKHSSIVMFSTVAVNPGMAFHASISAAKGAVEGLTRSLAAEFAPNIRVNAIAPSLTDTRLASGILSSDEKKESSGKRHPLGRVGTPDDIASMAVYLLSDKAVWITGQVIGVDGGMGGTR